ncbi:cbb3-type cytochrome oxidase assembly protein CcoS [Cellvibrio polysaccharolyticus]|uniref:Cbb3-type cytochrome oxidase assembly protein CcoS n=1 Tax=Cellvibrio polysaccharolyticus TaxID=2082724 RepID=A0A928YU69_9GAMM|nr:cbb3-type cytochrome oxidase assembly protein CcoS [Cellvibrio polysaccharolyticus]MBE8718331.1 cbb3-type cytochrome oxidase assembly protein CcoS [Cellvibrio polysaccharolyticus]
MEIYFFIIPVGLIFIGLAIRFLFWALKSGQYDNLETEANRILFDDDTPLEQPAKPQPAATGKDSSPDKVD